MHRRLFNISKTLFFGLLLFLTTQCKEEENSQVVDIEDFLPSSAGQYEYNESDSSIVKKTTDVLLDSLTSIFKQQVISQEQLSADDKWRYSPDRMGSDTSVARVFIIGGNEFLYKCWKYSDSLLSINAFYNWLDCFGPTCKSITIGDSLNVSKESFILFQNNESIHFIKSTAPIDIDKWFKFVGSIHKRNWNYVIEQPAHGTLLWRE